MSQVESQGKLRSQLLHFGLNPQEWTLERLSTTLYLISHHQDKEFAFIGRCQFNKSRPRWKSLEVLAL